MSNIDGRWIKNRALSLRRDQMNELLELIIDEVDGQPQLAAWLYPKIAHLIPDRTSLPKDERRDKKTKLFEKYENTNVYRYRQILLRDSVELCQGFNGFKTTELLAHFASNFDKPNLFCDFKGALCKDEIRALGLLLHVAGYTKQTGYRDLDKMTSKVWKLPKTLRYLPREKALEGIIKIYQSS